MRRPFVATLTLFAAACHASSESAGASDSAVVDAALDADADAADAARFESGSDSDATSPPCPPTRPLLGTACALPKTQRCAYLDPCPSAPTHGGNDVLLCVDRAWSIATDAYSLDCPTPHPTPGDACLCAAHFPSGCVIGVCPDLALRDFLICDDASKSWIAQSVPCNPPPPDAGPDADADPDADPDSD